MPPFLLNMPDQLKVRVNELAKQDEVSTTQWILLALAEKVGERRSSRARADGVHSKKKGSTTTVKGNEFSFEKNSKGGLWVESSTGSRWDVPAGQFAFAKAIIEEHGRLEMGGSRDQPKKGSLGAKLLSQFKVNNASYIVPILRDEKFCSVELASDGRTFWVTKNP